MSDLEDLARKIKGLEDRVSARNATQLDSSTIDVGDSDSLVVSDVMSDAAESSTVAIPGLQEALDLNAARIQDNADAVQVALDAVDAALEAADAAEAAGIAAGEEASAAAAAALDKAQEALDAAAAAGGGATYSGAAPTASTAGVPGQQWFVWDSNYHVTAYYVYNGATSTWVQTVLDDGTFGNLSAARLTSGFIDAARIAAGSLTAAVLAADTITSREIAADAILARNIKAAEITGAKIAAATIAAGNIVAKTITAGQIAAGTITAGEIKAGTITANEIAAGTITATEINLDTLNGKTLTGVVYRSAATGQRAEIISNQINFYSPTNALAGNIRGVNYSYGSGTYPVVALGGSTYGITAGGGVPQWSGTTVGLSVNGDTDVKRLFLNPSLGSDGYVCGIYGFQRASSTDSTPVPMPLLYAKGNSGSAYPDMFIENIKSVAAGDFIGPGSTSIVPLTGTATYSGTLAAGTSDTMTVTFPQGRFTSPPLVNANGSNSRVVIGINAVTKDSVTFALGNWTSGASGAPTIYYTATPRP